MHQETNVLQKRRVLRTLVGVFGLTSSLLLLISTAFFSLTNASAHPTTSLVPPLQTSCPAPGHARAAIMPAFKLGTHANLVYLFNDVPSHTSSSFGRLMRYDVTTGKRTQIVSSGLSLESAQVSADGQWILFLSTPDPRGNPHPGTQVQLVRIDGQALQTLYCVPETTTINNAQWTTDQKLIAFSFSQQQGTGSGITLLNVRTGGLQTDLFSPRSHVPYQPLTWLDTTRLYVTSPQLDAPSNKLFILDTRRGPNQNPSQLQPVFTASNQYCWNADSSYDARSLFSTSCTSAYTVPGPGPSGSQGPSSIAMRPSTGGTAHTIFTSNALAITAIRSVSPTTLLVLVQNHDFGKQVDTSQNGLWEMHSNGTGFTRLTSDPNTLQAFAPFTQLPWSNVSRDQQHFALQVSNYRQNNVSSVLLGSFNGGTPISVATASGMSSVEQVGWTTL